MFDKGTKTVQWRKDSLCNKWSWSNCTSISKKGNFGKEFRLDTKNTIKENNFIKIKVFCLAKDPVKRMKNYKVREDIIKPHIQKRTNI